MVGGKLNRPPAKSGKRVGLPEAPPNWNDYPPLFSFDHMAASHSVATCNDEEKAALADSMWRRSRITWRELRSAGRHGLGAEKITRINQPRPAVVTDDVTLLAFRFSGMKAMIGFREGRIFHVIWLDSDFEVYDH